MKTILDHVEDVFKSDGVALSRTSDSRLIIGRAGKNGVFETIVVDDEEGRTLEIHTLCPIRLPAASIASVAELGHRLNRQVAIGSCLLDYKERILAFKTSIMIGDAMPDDAILRHLLAYNWWASDRHLPIISAVIFGNVTPAAAIEALSKAETEPAEQKTSNADSASQHTRPSHRLRGLFGESNN